MSGRGKAVRKSGTARGGLPSSPGEGVAVRDAQGTMLHGAPPPIVSELRYTFARMRLQDGKNGVPSRLGVTAALRGEGVSFVSRSMAGLLANDSEATVCLVELDWWSDRPVQERGIADVARGRAELEDALVTTDNPRLHFLPAGTVEPSDRPILAKSMDLQDVIERLTVRFDHLVLDLPSFASTSETLTLAGLSEAVVMVVRQGATPIEDVRKAMDHLSGVRILGVVLNRDAPAVPAFLRRWFT